MEINKLTNKLCRFSKKRAAEVTSCDLQIKSTPLSTYLGMKIVRWWCHQGKGERQM